MEGGVAGLFTKAKRFMTEQKLLVLLSSISFDSWEKIVRGQPEWIELKPFLSTWSFGPFALMMVMVALNDYQLKGRAENMYWPKLRQIFERAEPPKAPFELHKILLPFYERERLWKNKLQRLRIFLESALAHEICQSSPKRAAAQFLSIWDRLAKTMQPREPAPEAKTIVFSMKCLGLALIMARHYEFDFSPIPIPVDSRVRKFTRTINPRIKTDERARAFWKKVLSVLQKSGSRLTMIHLDSFIWQIAHFEETELREYFHDYCIMLKDDIINELCFPPY